MENKETLIFSELEVLRNKQLIKNKIKRGEVFVYPTDTLYGLGVSIEKDLEKIYNIKGRELSKTLSIFVRIEDLEDYAFINDLKLSRIKRFYDKGYTFLLKSKINNPYLVKDGLIAIRIAYTPLLRILTEYSPITATSANISGEKSVYSFEHLDKELLKKVDFAIRGECKYKRASIILDLENNKILRK